MIFRFITVLLLGLISLGAQAQDFSMNLYPEGHIPLALPCTVTEKWDTTNAVRVSGITVPGISVYIPSPRHRTGAAVLICPGGGYKVEVVDFEGEDIAAFWNSKGVTAIVLKYRLPLAGCQEQPWLVPLTDARRAMRLIRYHAEEWDIDPSRIGVMGFSAGGHLASSLSTHFDSGDPANTDPVEQLSCRPDFSILVYPVITMTATYQHKGSRSYLVGEDLALQEEFSSELQVSPETPPTFIVHAADDKSVPVENSLVYYQALVVNKVPAELHIFPAGGHAFSLGVNKGHLDIWPELCNNWLRSLSGE